MHWRPGCDSLISTQQQWVLSTDFTDEKFIHYLFIFHATAQQISK